MDLASKGCLRYAPSRVRTYITSSSVLLLKVAFVCRAACVHAETSEDLQSLEKAISALRASAVDDMDLSCRYAVLIEAYTGKLRTWVAPDRHAGTNHDHMIHSDGHIQLGRVRDYTLLDNDISFEPTSDGLNHGVVDDSWWALPFDPSLAPFTSSEHAPFTLGFQADSLDFLWNCTEPSISN